MDVDYFVTESFAFTRAAVVGQWSRWVILILLGLPWMILSALLVSRNIFDGKIIRWDLIPWNETAGLIIIGILCNLLLSGYLVRLLRGHDTPPPFTFPSRLILDGIKVHVIPLIWILVPLLIAVVEYVLVSGRYAETVTVLALLLLIAVIQLLILLFAVNYAVIGITRFARTGSVRAAFDIPAIKGTFDRIGIVNYYIALGVITLVFLLFTFVFNLIALIPLAGPVLSLALGPLLTVYCIRFIAHFCDEDLSPAATQVDTIPIRALVTEYVVWSVALVVLLVLCFTPLAVVSGAFSNALLW